MMEGSHAARCRLEPCLTIECSPKMLMWIVEQAAKAPAEWPISCIMIAASVTPKPDAAKFLGHRDAEPSALGDGFGEFMGKLVGPVFL